LSHRPIQSSATMEHLIRRRDFLIASAALPFAGSLLSACGRRSPGVDLPVLRVSTVGKGEGDMRLLQSAANIRAESFRVDYSNFASGQLVIEALDGGALDFGNMSEIPPVFAAASPIQSFRQIAVLHGDVNNQVVLVPRGSAVTSLADLKGKRVGYVRATTSQYFLVRMLQSVGLTWSDITSTPMGVSDGLAAFSNGQLDAWAIYGYPIQRVMATEGARILKTALGFLSGNYIISAHVDALADPVKSKLIGEYLRVCNRAYAWGAAHEEQWTTIIAKDIGVPLEYVRDQFRRKSDSYSLRPVDQTAIASQQNVADVFAQQALIPKPVDVRPLWDDRFNDITIEKV
jgi:sulfonate transport system substrate-binding protein